MYVNTVIPAARMIPFKARAPKNDLVEAWANWFGSTFEEMGYGGLVVDLVRRMMNGCTMTQKKIGTLGL